MSVPQKDDPIKFCRVCGAQLHRKRFDSGRLEDRSVFLRRQACSQSCANSRGVVSKDALHWRARKHRKAACEDCGVQTALHVHHIDKDVTNNDPTNLRTLCASCHLTMHWVKEHDARVLAMSSGVSTRQR